MYTKSVFGYFCMYSVKICILVLRTLNCYLFTFSFFYLFLYNFDVSSKSTSQSISGECANACRAPHLIGISFDFVQMIQKKQIWIVTYFTLWTDVKYLWLWIEFPAVPLNSHWPIHRMRRAGINKFAAWHAYLLCMRPATMYSLTILQSILHSYR